jgi:hypothetical protein
VTGVEGAIEKPAVGMIVTEYVTLWVWVVGIDDALVAVPVMVTAKVVIADAVPLKVTRSVTL